MADREIVFHVTIPAGTAQTAPLTTPLPWNPGHLIRLHVTIPDGHAGLTGYAFTYAGTQVVPDGVGVYIVSNDEKIQHDIAVPYVGQQWALVGYNTDVYDHTFHVRAEVDEISTPTPAATLPAIITPATIETLPADSLLPDAPDATGLAGADALIADLAGAQ